MRKNKLTLSVVIICRNEESNISKCIESVIREVKDIPSEIIIVDSASTDKTIEIAKKYPVKIFQIEKSKYLSPSGGRYIGTKKSVGEFIFFIDADVIIIKGWIKKALKYFSEKRLAGVRGKLFNVPSNEKISMNHEERGTIGYDQILGGQAAIYRRTALQECGTFNPYLKGEEERELYHRIISKGWRLRKVDVPMAYHMNKTTNIQEVNEKAGYFKGVGQIIRYYLFRDISLKLIKNHKKVFKEIFFLYICLLAVILTFWMKNKILFYAILVIGIIFIMVVSYIKHPYKLYLYIRSRFMISINILIGFFKGINSHKTYLKHVNIKRLK